MRWLLVKDLQILRRSPLLVVLLVAYPVLVALLIGFALSGGPEKPRVAFVNLVPEGEGQFSVGGETRDAADYSARLFKAVDPIRVEPNSEGNWNAIIGGFFYRGSRLGGHVRRRVRLPSPRRTNRERRDARRDGRLRWGQLAETGGGLDSQTMVKASPCESWSWAAAASTNSVDATNTPGMPLLSRSAMSCTLHDVQDPQSARASITTSHDTEISWRRSMGAGLVKVGLL